MKRQFMGIFCAALITCAAIMSPSVAFGQEGGFAASIDSKGAQAVALVKAGEFKNVHIGRFNLGDWDAGAMVGLQSNVSMGFYAVKGVQFADNGKFIVGPGLKPFVLDSTDRWRPRLTLVLGASWRF